MTRAAAAAIVPALVAELELGAALGPQIEGWAPQAARYPRVRCLVRLAGLPLGMVDVPLRPAPEPTAVADLVWKSLGGAIATGWRGVDGRSVQDLSSAGLIAGEPVAPRPVLPAPAPFVTVVITTHDRLDDLDRCLVSMAAQTYPNFEMIVVDNGCSNDHAQRLVERRAEGDPRIRYRRELQDGPCPARNVGIRAARGELISFTDDDVVVDSGYLNAIVGGFAAGERVGCVTGLVLPGQLETREQSWFEDASGFARGFERRVYDLGPNRSRDPLYPLIAGIFGGGASMAFRAEALHAFDGFDPALGPGTPARSGDDLAAYVDTLFAGYQIVYEPAAIAWHRHRGDYRALRRQMFGYGTGTTAYLTKSVIERPTVAAHLLRGLPRIVWRMSSPNSYANARKPSDYPRRLTLIERAGMVVGPPLYLRDRLRKRDLIRVRPRSSAVGAAGQDVDPALAPPIQTVQIELTVALPELQPRLTDQGEDRAVRCLVRLAGRPLGLVTVPFAGRPLSADRLAGAIWTDLADEIRAQWLPRLGAGVSDLPAAGLPVGTLTEAEPALPDPAPTASVVVTTRDRADDLATCLAHLQALDYPVFEVIVVDNASSDDATRAVACEAGVLYVRENFPGLGEARNRGIRAASGEIIAFTDDDVRVDRGWLMRLIAGFTRAPRVGCVTGLVVAAELDTAAQVWFDGHARFTKGFTPQAWDLGARAPSDPLFPFAAGIYGTGASMAFRADTLRRVGGFDPALGTGTPAAGGDDLDAFLAVLLSGEALVYEPSAVAHHRHRRDYQALRRQMETYGSALSAYLTKAVLRDPRLLLTFSRLAARGLRHLLGEDSARAATRPSDYPRELLRVERAGMLRGPGRYLVGRRRAARKLGSEPTVWRSELDQIPSGSPR